MTTPYFFGYGSLVNRRTHDYDQAHCASINGWRRIWRHVEGRRVAFLTAVEDRSCTLDGLIAGVPNSDWAALDERERSYLRVYADDVDHPLPPHTDIQIYHAPDGFHRPATTSHPILMSYIDVVVQGFLTEYGESGVHRFFATTDGWDAPVLDDRDAPVYRRHQQTQAAERALTDACLSQVHARILPREAFPDF